MLFVWTICPTFDDDFSIVRKGIISSHWLDFACVSRSKVAYVCIYVEFKHCIWTIDYCSSGTG